MIWEYLVQTVEADRVRMSGFAGTIPGVPDENLHNQVLQPVSKVMRRAVACDWDGRGGGA